MKRMLLLLGLLGGFGTTTAKAQTRVSVSIWFGTRMSYPRYFHQPYIVYYPRPAYYPRPPVIVIARPLDRPARVIVVRPYGHGRRHRHYHGYH